MKLRLLVLPLIVGAAALSFGQAKLNFTQTANEAQDMASASQGLLLDPKVLVALKLSQTQIATGYFRTMLEPLRTLLKAKAKNPDTDIFDVFSNFNWSAALTTVKVSDLTLGQRQRLYEIALQENLFTALQTPEIGMTLRITPSQRKVLEAISANCNAAFTKSMSALGNDKRFKAITAKVDAANQPDSNEEVTPERVDKAFDLFYEFMPVMVSKFMDTWKPLADGADKKALRLLTLSQRRQLKRMQGKPISRD